MTEQFEYLAASWTMEPATKCPFA